MKVCLVETALPDSKGSMRRYADIIASAFLGDKEIEIERICVAEEISPSIGKLKTIAHHVVAIRNGRRLAKQGTADLFHVIDGSHGYLARILRRRRTVVTVHDIIPKLQSEGQFETVRPGLISRQIIDRALDGLRHADHLIFDSDSTCQDYSKFAVPNRGENSVLFPPLEQNFVRRKSGTEAADRVKAPFLFHIGNNGFYKNRAGVIEVYSRIAKLVPHDLVLAGPPPSPPLLSHVTKFGLEDRVRFESNPTDERVHFLYRHANALIFPSFYEGFGWPPIEAMALGCPVVCSDGGSLGEVVGKAAMVSAAGDDDAMAKNLLSLLSNDGVRENLVTLGLEHAKQFEVEPFQRQLRRIYREAAGVASSSVT